MRISDLYTPDGPLFGKSVKIIGSGPSIDCYPPGAFDNKTCVLLNDVCQSRPQWGPVAFSNNVKFLNGCELEYQIVKGRLVPPKEKGRPGQHAVDNHVKFDDPKYFVFSYRSPQQGDAWDHFDDCALWREDDFYFNVKGGSISIFAVQFCLLAGATEIQLVGCDCSQKICRYNSEKESRRDGRHVKHNYKAYWSGMLRMIDEAWNRFGVLITSENPWPGYGWEQESYRRMARA